MARRKNRLFKTGRNATATAFIMLENYVFDCDAFRTMKLGPRCLLFELIRRHNGSNNGAIALGVRDAAKRLGVNKDTASGYFRALVERGFIAPSRPGGFNVKDPTARRATEWRLTWIRCGDQPPTKEFMSAAGKTAVPISRTARPNQPDTKGDFAFRCPKKPDQTGDLQPAAGPSDPDTYTSGHRPSAESIGFGWWASEHMMRLAIWTALLSNLSLEQAA